MLTVERTPDGSEKIDLSVLRQGLPLDPDYSITARPALVAITSGAIVRYTLLYKGVLTTVPRLEAAGSKGRPGLRYLHVVQIF